MANAIGQMSNIATAMQTQERDIRREADAMQNAAAAAGETAGLNQQQVAVQNKMLAQNSSLFAIQQQPWVDINPDAPAKDYAYDGQRFGWHYFFKNFGPSPARNLRITESLYLLNSPHPQTNVRIGQPFMATNAGGDSTAFYAVSPKEAEEIRKGRPVGLRLRVLFNYTDQFRRKHANGFCRYIVPRDGSVYVCK